MSATPQQTANEDEQRHEPTTTPDGRLAELPSGRIAEVTAVRENTFETIILSTGHRTTVHRKNVAFLGGGSK